MALFNKNNDQDVTQNYKFGEEEYTKEQLEELVSFGKLAKEAEERYNTKIDRVYPEFTKKTQQIKEYEQKLQDYENKFKEFETKNTQPVYQDDEQVRLAKEAAKKIGLLTKEDIEELGLITKDRFNQEYNSVRQAEKLLDEMTKYAKDLDGSDGRPKFDIDEILEYMNESGINDFKVAYKIKYDDQLTLWKDKEINKSKKPGLYTQDISTFADKSPRESKTTKDNLSDSIRQALQGRI